jgi:aminoglycoside 6'-N-acetyltransferase I
MAAPQTAGVEVRTLTAADAALLERVAPGVFDDPLDAAATRRFLDDPRHHLAVAIDGGTIVGMASAVHYDHPDKPAPEMWVNEVGVAPTHRERGLGKRLLARIIDEARALGCSEAWVLTDRSNHPALRLYRSLGGEERPYDQVMLTFVLK